VLVPLRIEWRDPEELGSADSAGACRCDDGMEYALKDGRHHPLTPHAEWFCTKLAEAVGIACPPCAIIEDERGNFLFGSRWEGGVARDNWWDMTERGEIDIALIAPVLSRILAFDLFVHNGDRHLNNYLVRESRNNWTVMAFDFSRAWTFNGYILPPLPFSPRENTVAAHRWLTRNLGEFLDQGAADQVLERLRAVNKKTIVSIIAMQPRDWLPIDDANGILDWWDGGARAGRIDAIKKGISDGTYI
jgi:hypothetical protein